jgi:hypothetical protein
MLVLALILSLCRFCFALVVVFCMHKLFGARTVSAVRQQRLTVFSKWNIALLQLVTGQCCPYRVCSRKEDPHPLEWRVRHVSRSKRRQALKAFAITTYGKGEAAVASARCCGAKALALGNSLGS